MAYTSAGRFDGYWNRGLKYYEMAAGTLLITEAGGLVEGITLHQNALESGTIIAANGEGHAKFAKLVRDI
jgi:myo-inositol-1(or 4)-monophosphatase